MACDLIQTELAGCLSEIKKIESQTRLLRLIAELTCEIADAGGGGGTPGGAPGDLQFNDAGAFGGFGDYNSGTGLLTLTGNLTVPLVTGNLTGNVTGSSSLNVLKAGDTMTGALLFSADNTIDIGASGATRARTGYFGTSVVTALIASPAATALSFASAGTTRANFDTSGHLLFNTDATNNIGAVGANRPLRGHFSSGVTCGVSVTTPIVVSAGTLNIAATTALTLEAGGAARWQISGANFIAITDNANDIGAAGATRPRNLFLAGGLAVEATVTAAGTTGNQTIDKFAGTVNFAAAATAITVTCNKCTTSSLVFAVVRTNDTTSIIKNVVPGAGSFVINLNAAATAETSVGFHIVNPD